MIKITKTTLLFIFLFIVFQLNAQNEIIKKATSEPGAIEINVHNGGKGNDVSPPKLSITNPIQNQTFYIRAGGGKGLKPTIKIGIRGITSDISGIEKVQINGNTALINFENGNFYKELEFPVGKHSIMVLASDKKGNSNKKELTVNVEIKAYIPPEIKKHTLYVLSIGISDYKNAGSKGLQNLKYADKDAQSILNLFNTMKGILFSNVYSEILTDEEATRKNILKKMQWLEENVEQGDVAIIFVSSHGFNENGKAYLMPYDGELDFLKGTAIDFSDINETLMILSNKNTTNGKVLFMADACHSGNFGIQGSKGASSVQINEALKMLDNKEYGVMRLLSSTDKEQSYEFDDLEHGAFTFVILDALKNRKADTNNDFIISFDELVVYVKTNVKNVVYTRNGKIQRPVSKNPASIYDFPVFILK